MLNRLHPYTLRASYTIGRRNLVNGTLLRQNITYYQQCDLPTTGCSNEVCRKRLDRFFRLEGIYQVTQHTGSNRFRNTVPAKSRGSLPFAPLPAPGIDIRVSSLQRPTIKRPSRPPLGACAFEYLHNIKAALDDTMGSLPTFRRALTVPEVLNYQPPPPKRLRSLRTTVIIVAE